MEHQICFYIATLENWPQKATRECLTLYMNAIGLFPKLQNYLVPMIENTQRPIYYNGFKLGRFELGHIHQSKR